MLTAKEKTINYHYVCYETLRDAEKNPNRFYIIGLTASDEKLFNSDIRDVSEACWRRGCSRCARRRHEQADETVAL